MVRCAEFLLSENIDELEEYAEADPESEEGKIYEEIFQTHEETIRGAIDDFQQALELASKAADDYYGSDVERSRFLFHSQNEAANRLIYWLDQLGESERVYQTVESVRAVGLQNLMRSSGIDVLSDLPEETARRLQENQKNAAKKLKSLQMEFELLVNGKSGRESTKREIASEISRLDNEIVEARRAVRDAATAIQSARSFRSSDKRQDRTPIDFQTLQKRLEETKTIVLEYAVFKIPVYDNIALNLLYKKDGFLYKTALDNRNSLAPSVFLLVYGYGFDEPRLFPLVATEKLANYWNRVLPDWNIEPGPLRSSVLEQITRNGKNGILDFLIDDSGDDKLVSTLLNSFWSLLIPDAELRRNLTNDVYDRVLILPDGSLSLFPFEALVVENRSDDPVYFLDRCPPIVYSPSASVYCDLIDGKRIRRDSNGGSLRNILTLGDPEYPSGEANENLLTATQQASGVFDRTILYQFLTPLPHTGKESDSIVALSDKNPSRKTTQLKGDQATEKNLRRHIQGKQLVHLACHGFVDDSFGNFFGGLATTPGDRNDPRDDGFLTLSEISELDWSDSELVVLSACDTNCGTVQLGEGVWSLGRGTIAAGARRTLASNWSVDDESTAFCVSAFISNLFESEKSGEIDYAQGIRDAKRSLRRQKEWSRPYYWAPFVLWGIN